MKKSIVGVLLASAFAVIGLLASFVPPASASDGPSESQAAACGVGLNELDTYLADLAVYVDRLAGYEADLDFYIDQLATYIDDLDPVRFAAYLDTYTTYVENFTAYAANYATYVENFTAYVASYVTYVADVCNAPVIDCGTTIFYDLPDGDVCTPVIACGTTVFYDLPDSPCTPVIACGTTVFYIPRDDQCSGGRAE